MELQTIVWNYEQCIWNYKLYFWNYEQRVWNNEENVQDIKMYEIILLSVNYFERFGFGIIITKQFRYQYNKMVYNKMVAVLL